MLGNDVLVVEAARTPFGRSHPEKGWFRDTHPDDLLAAVRILDHMCCGGGLGTGTLLQRVG